METTKVTFEFKDGYEGLFDILMAAYNRAAQGKGEERHGRGRQFMEQPIITIPKKHDSPFGLLFQIEKKLDEIIGFYYEPPTTDGGLTFLPNKLVEELLDVINYTAALIIYFQREVP